MTSNSQLHSNCCLTGYRPKPELAAKIYILSIASYSHHKPISIQGILQLLTELVLYYALAFKSREGGSSSCFLRRNTCYTGNIHENICRVHVFFMRKGVQEYLGSSKKVMFLVETAYLAFGFTTFAENLLTRWRPGGYFAPLLS